MATHKNRSGALLVCYPCRNSAHKDCMSNDPGIANEIVCHCTCQPTCTRKACQPENVKTGRRKSWPATCPGCDLSPCFC